MWISQYCHMNNDSMNLIYIIIKMILDYHIDFVSLQVHATTQVKGWEVCTTQLRIQHNL